VSFTESICIVIQIPIDQAFDLMLTGKNVRPSKAKKLGLIDVVVNPLGNILHLLFCGQFKTDIEQCTF